MIAETATSSVKEIFARGRIVTDRLFAKIRSDAFYDRPVHERHRLIFYVGHLESFDWNLLRDAAGLSTFHPEFDELFAFGIDPEPGQAPSDQPSDWPTLEDVQAYSRQARQAIDQVAHEADEQLLRVAYEHRLMHAETSAYLMHRLRPEQKDVGVPVATESGSMPPSSFIEVPQGTATLGRPRHSETSFRSFGWDNEFEGYQISVPAFAMSRYKVSNGEYLDFVRAGASAPAFWTMRDGRWYWRAMAGERPLPLDWPVYVTHAEAKQYATWAGKRLPTEAEFHRAAYGTPGGHEQSYPWGEEPPDRRRGNFGGHHWDPVAVTATPQGDSAFSISQLVGNGWEWTSTAFHGFPGFRPFDFYPGYSARFFDGAHYVLKGASPRTPYALLRRSFRNWFRSDYPYVYAGFRCVEQ
jgi:gamma-glutamyl hercynylcysteine S-oxide synthase